MNLYPAQSMYTDSKGSTWYLHYKDVTLKNGGARRNYFYAKSIKDDAHLAVVPRGMEPFEASSGMLMLRKSAIQPTDWRKALSRIILIILLMSVTYSTADLVAFNGELFVNYWIGFAVGSLWVFGATVLVAHLYRVDIEKMRQFF